jgi:hypothetical protein
VPTRLGHETGPETSSDRLNSTNSDCRASQTHLEASANPKIVFFRPPLRVPCLSRDFLPDTGTMGSFRVVGGVLPEGRLLRPTRCPGYCTISGPRLKPTLLELRVPLVRAVLKGLRREPGPPLVYHTGGGNSYAPLEPYEKSGSVAWLSGSHTNLCGFVTPMLRSHIFS